MRINSIKILIKISILTTCFIVIINFLLISFLKLPSNINITQEDNKYIFNSADSNNLWNVALAITTNIWIWYKKRIDTPIESYKDIKELSEFLWNPETILDNLIQTNMLTIKDYVNFAKTDIKDLLDNSSNRKDSIESIISWFEFRYKTASKNRNILNNYRNLLIQEMNDITLKIEILKTKMNNDAKKYLSKESIENINSYTIYKKEYNYNKVKVVYINHFLRQYDFLNKYTKIILDTLINNKEAIINKWRIVLPDSWDSLIKKFDLIYSEEEWKNELKKQELQ